MEISIGGASLLLLVLALVFVFKTINVVPQQHAWVVERLGKYHATLGPGLNIVVPLGIAEEHAVLFACGMATMGFHPVCAI